MLIVLGVATYDVVKDPESVQFVQIITEKIHITDQAFHGRIGDKDIEIKMSEPIRYLFFGIMGLIMLSIMVSIINGLILGGVALVRLAVNKENSNKNEIVKSVGQI